MGRPAQTVLVLLGVLLNSLVLLPLAAPAHADSGGLMWPGLGFRVTERCRAPGD